MTSRREKAIALAENIRSRLDNVYFEAMSLSTIDGLIGDLRSLKSAFPWPCDEFGLAIAYLEKMKRPRSDKSSLGASLLNVVYGIHMNAYQIDVERISEA
jgi:hypothetical protein